MRASLACLLFALSPSLHADLWVVDPSGAGDFTQISAAVAAAAPGDSILVLPGAYNDVVIDKGLRILGAGPDVVTVGQFLSTCTPIPAWGLECPPLSGSTGVTVRNLPAGETVFVSGLRARGHSSQAGVHPKLLLEDNAGVVHLHDVQALPEGVYGERTLVINDSALALISSSEFHGASGSTIGAPASAIDFSSAAEGVSVSGSTVWVMNSTVGGGDGGAFDAFAGPSGRVGLSLVDSVAYLAGTAITGGSGGYGYGSPVTIYGPGGDGLSLTNSVVKNVGGAGNTVVGGGSGAGVQAHGASIELVMNSIAFHSPSVVVETDFNVDSTSVLVPVNASSPTLAGDLLAVQPGQTVEFEVAGTPGHLAVLYIANDLAGPLTAPGVDGSFVLSLDGILTGGVSALDPAGAATLPVPVPPNPALVGFVGFIQAAVTDGSDLAFSNVTGMPIF